MATGAVEFTERLHRMLSDLLGPGQGTCLDLGCGNGYHSARFREVGRTPVGVDISIGQLRHGRGPRGRLPVAQADGTRLPVAGAQVARMRPQRGRLHLGSDRTFVDQPDGEGGNLQVEQEPTVVPCSIHRP